MWRKLLLMSVISFMVTTSFSQSVEQCCILMDISENGKKIEDDFEVWDFFIDTDRGYFTLNVSSFILMDDLLGKKPQYHIYNWHHKAKSITSKGNRTFEIITDGRRSNFEMRIIVTFGEGYFVEDLSAFLPIGTNGKEIKQFNINKEKATINISPLYNSAFIAKSK